ncbi:MAG: lipoyl(octanoyl) transferase LipB [Gammaproteobacteria bacterium]|nr:lipoyl(octanoyl) transferase LipB [Gammaproteobacteria bacterium]
MISPRRSLDLRTESGHLICVKYFGLVDYQTTLPAMAEFATHRDHLDQDQIWALQHPPVYTQGTTCQQGPLNLSSIPVVKTDRGGQITYHGPGQIVMYPMLSLKRYGLSVKGLVRKLEQAVIALLAELEISGERRLDAPGVYVDDKKIAALGLRIRRGTSYHGLSLNVDMDLTPFANIDPCGFRGLQVTQLADHIDRPDLQHMTQRLLKHFVALI